MKIKSLICSVSIIFTAILFISGCSVNNNNNSELSKTLNSTSDNKTNIEEATEKEIVYKKQGFFTPTEVQIDEMVRMVMNYEDVWTDGLDEDDIYFMEFADLNFDGKIEFIVCDTLYDEKSLFHANAYYVDNGQLKKAEVVDGINPMDGYDNYYTAYFDKENGDYVVIGHNYTKPDEQYSEDLIYKLLFDGEKISIEHLLNKTAYSEDNHTYADDINTYYKFESESAVEISEKEYNLELSNIEENDDWVEIITSPIKNMNVKYDDWKSARTDEKEQLLKEALSKLSYDIYVPEGVDNE